MELGNTAAQSERATQLDPARLPLRFAAPDAAADGGERRIVLDRSEVMVARHVGRTAMNIKLPMQSFRGVAVRVMPGLVEGEDRIAIVLAHRDRALDVTLYEADHDADVIAEWQTWATTLGLPLLIEELDGRLSEAYTRLGQVQVSRPRPRRRRSFLARRPRFLMRRKPAQLGGDIDVIHDVCEMIARD
jgi:hypothetical protein